MEAARTAIADDLTEVLALADLARAEIHDLKGGPRYLEREGRSEPDRAALQSMLDDAEQHCVVGTIDDVIVAFAAARTEMLRTGDLIAEMTEIWVMPEARGVGLGEVMLDAIMDWARSEGCVSLEGSVHPGNRDAKNFFERAAMVTRLLRVSTSLVDE